MLNKILKITAAAAFMIALAVNIDMMINDPFVGMSTEAIATDTDSGTDSIFTEWEIYEEDLHKCGVWYAPDGTKLYRWETYCLDDGSEECTPQACI